MSLVLAVLTMVEPDIGPFDNLPIPLDATNTRISGCVVIVFVRKRATFRDTWVP